MTRLSVLLLGIVLTFVGAVPLARRVFADRESLKVTLKAEGAQPREVEDTTEKAIVRDYSTAWRTIESGLANDDVNALDEGLVGLARDQFAAAIDQQKKTGMKVRYTDGGHQLEAVFYSPDGSAMQLRDTAKLSREILDGNKVIHRDDITAHYLAIMSVSEDHWKLRSLEEVPNF
jgi:hypothetical protein